MKIKPWSLVVLAILHVLAPIGNLFLNALRASRSLEEQWHYWFDILPKYLLALYILLPVLAGIFIFLCRRWSYWAYVICIGFILISNIYSYWTSMAFTTLLALLGVGLVDVLVVAYFMVPSVQKIYFDPRMRWWEAAPRYNFNCSGFLNGTQALFKNISLGGLFMTDGPEVKEGDRVQLTWDFEKSPMVITGIVVYRGPQRGVFGAGIKFEHNEATERAVKDILNKLEDRGLIVVERLPGPEDSFAVWLKKLVTTGEGLFPSIRK